MGLPYRERSTIHACRTCRVITIRARLHRQRQRSRITLSAVATTSGDSANKTSGFCANSTCHGQPFFEARSSLSDFNRPLSGSVRSMVGIFDLMNRDVRLFDIENNSAFSAFIGEYFFAENSLSIVFSRNTAIGHGDFHPIISRRNSRSVIGTG